VHSAAVGVLGVNGAKAERGRFGSGTFIPDHLPFPI